MKPVRDILADARGKATTSPAAALDLLETIKTSGASVADWWAACQLLAGLPPEVRAARAVAGVKVAVLANHTTTYTAAALEFELSPRLHGILFESDFDAWEAELQVEGSKLARFGPDVVVVHVASLGMTGGATRLEGVPVVRVEDAVKAFASRSDARIVLVLPEPLPECTGGTSAADAWFREAQARFVDLAGRLQAAGVAVVVEDPLRTLLRTKGNWVASRFWSHGKLPFHPSACIAFGRRLAQVIESMVSPRIKAVAVDCDNTLWGGEVGDVGAAAVNLSALDSGGGYLRLQRLLKEAVGRGIVLIALSKNEESSVRAVFEERSEMLLSLDDFSVLKVNWQPKAHNLQEAVAELNIGLDSVLFLDDSPFERAQMAAMLPQVTVVDMPRDADEFASTVAATGLLERSFVTPEDLRRIQMYREERLRERARSGDVSAEEFLRSLGLRLFVHPVGTDNLMRVTQMLAKTNQFNLTTRRHGAEAISRMTADKSGYARCFQLVDRFGDAGIVGVLLARAEGEAAVIDTLLMSCRVLGRTAEYAMLAHLRTWAASRGLRTIIGEYRRTPKNAPIAQLLPSSGFTLVGSTGETEQYSFDVAGGTLPVHYVELVESGQVPAGQRG
ncbi:MAG: HAD-IIIC family phosphatase [Acidobacteriota bacterium]